MKSNGLDERRRARTLVAKFGWNALSAQVLRAGFRFWLPDDAVGVAYVDTGRAWVAAGAPIAPVALLRDAAERFTEAARAAGRRAVFFGVEDRFTSAVPWTSHLVGRQPVWDPTRWPDVIARTPSLRAQVRRATNKGVEVRELSPERARTLRPELAALRAAWLRSRPLAPLRFLVDPRLRSWTPRRTFVAERAGRVVGVATALEVAARGGFFIEHLWRTPTSPNGTTELLVDTAMRTFAAASMRWATLGLAPLHETRTLWMRAFRTIARPLYDFAGLAAFKAKLRPDRWDPIHIVHPRDSFAVSAFLDVAVAFTGSSLLRYAMRSVRHRLRRR